MSDGKKKLLMMTGIIVGAVVLIIIILLIYHAATNKTTTYTTIENKMATAARKYYAANKTLLPEKDGQQITIDDATLTSSGNMKSLSDMTSKMDGVSCTGEVVVTKTEGSYRYTPILNCGEKYKTETLVSYIKGHEQIVSADTGLYDLNGELVYRGEKPHNHIKFSGKMYRIVKITDNKAMLIYNDVWKTSVWDDRYNIEKSSTTGINNYETSRLKEQLATFDLIKDENKKLVAPQTLYIGKRAAVDTINDGSIEKSEIVENQKYGLLPLYDYINASADSNCLSVLTDSCINYNYLNKYDNDWWTITAAMKNSFRAYGVMTSGVIEPTGATTKLYLRPVIYLVSDALYVSGDGTYKNPYIVR